MSELKNKNSLKSARKKNSLVTGMIVGGAVGSVLSLLFSSKKNRDTAKNYSQKALTGGKSLAQSFLKKYFKPEEKPSSKKKDPADK